MKTYELTYIIPSGLNQIEIESTTKEIESFIQQKEGIILKSEKSLAKTLSYPIKKNSSGYFVTLILNILEDKVKELKEKLDKNNNILRHFILIHKPLKEISRRRMLIRPKAESRVNKNFDIKNFSEQKKTDKVEVKSEDIDKKLDEILSE